MRLAAPWKDRSAAVFAVVVVAAGVYANSLANGYAFDDMPIVVGNPEIQSLETLPGALVAPYWPGDYGRQLGLWRPTTVGLLGTLWVAGSGEPFLFHLANVIGHVVASALVLLVLLELMPLAAALVAALVFAVHPLHVEAVANVIGLAEIVSTVAVLAACLVHLRSGARTGWVAALAIGVLYAIGFGAKESAVTLPGLVFVLDSARDRVGFGDLGRYLAARWRPYAVMLAVAVATLTGRYLVLGSIAQPFAPLGADLLREIPRIWTLGEVWTHYVRLWVFPLDLSADYSPNVIPISIGWHATNALGAALALGAMAVSLVLWRRAPMVPDADTSRAAAFGVVWFLVAVSPVSNTVFLAGVLLAERTLYLPSVGLAAATGWAILRLWRERPRLAPIVLVAALGLSSARTWLRSPTWKDNETMLTTLVEETPFSGRSQWVLGDAFLARGRVSEGLLSYRAAIDLLGTHYQLLTEISKKLLDHELYRPAETLLRIAADNEPDFPLAPGLVALIRAEHGDAEATEAFARASLRLWDVDPTRHHLLAWALAAQGRFDEAASARATALDQGEALLWQQYMYEAYVRKEEGNAARALAAVDSAWAHARTDVGRQALDSVRVAEFGLASLLDPAESADSAGNK